MIYNTSNINDITYNNNVQPAFRTSPTYVTNKYYSGSCKFYNLKSGCEKGSFCQFFHITGEPHDCNLEPMSQYNKTDDDQLHYENVRPSICKLRNEYLSRLYYVEQKIKRLRENKTTSCPWYERGYCKYGPRCRYRHDENIDSFRSEQLPVYQVYDKFPNVADERSGISKPKIKICSYCKKPGHKASRCRQKKRNNMRLCRRCKCFEKIEATYKH